MAKRGANHRLVRFHFSYSVNEIADLLRVHKNTVRQWLKNGLAAIDTIRPTLVQGKVLIKFLKSRREQGRTRCGPTEMYCLRCRAPRVPAGQKAEYRPTNPTTGNLLAKCPVCNATMNRRASQAKLGPFTAEIDVTFTQAQPSIRVDSSPSVNSDFR